MDEPGPLRLSLEVRDRQCQTDSKLQQVFSLRLRRRKLPWMGGPRGRTVRQSPGAESNSLLVAIKRRALVIHP